MKSPPASPPLRDESEARLRAVFATAVEGIVTIDERGRIDSINPAAESMFGWGPGELIGQNISTLMPEPYRSGHDGYIHRYHSTGQRRIIGIGREVFGRRKDGSVFPVDLSVGEFSVGGRRLYTGILRDITERRRLQSEVLRIAELSQQRIGRDLHDDLCQQLAGIEYLSQTLARRLGEARRPETAAAAEIARLIRSAVEYTRDLSHGMSPLSAEPGSLATGLEELAVRTARHFNLGVEFVCPHPVSVPDTEVATHLYRIAQEAVSNAIRHGKASQIRISLTAAETRIHLIVHDNGRGLPQRLPKKRGLGLRIMQYRSGIIGATLAVQREESGGTSVRCEVDSAIHASVSRSHPSRPHDPPQKKSRSRTPKNPARR